MKMSRVKLFGALALLASLTIAASTFGLAGALAQKRPTTPLVDLKVRSRMTTGGADQGIETITYIKGARMRSEMGVTGTGMTNITQCDLRRNIMLNDQTRTYMITPLDASGDAGAAAAPGVPATAPPQTEKRRGGVVNVVNTIKDTGERKDMFGFTARRIKTSMVTETSPDACNPGSSRIETDGWYIDFEYDFNCPGQKPVVHRPGVPGRPDCQDEIRTRTVGSAKLGYPVHVTTTMQQGDGTTTTMTQEVLEISRAPLDAALFDIPAGYTLARSMQEMYGVSSAAANADKRPNDASPTETPAGPWSQTAGAPGLVAANAPKKEGAVRICQVTPKAQVTTGSAAQAAEAVRNTFAGYLTGPRLEITSLNARLPSQAMEEARQSQCDYVLYASMTQKKGGGGGMFSRAIGNVVGAAAGHIPVATAGEAAARGAVITGVYTTANIASNVKAKDEITLEYKLEPVGGARPALSKTDKAKAKSDGEDVLTPLIERAAEAIVAAAKL
jgi:hypothetical protein